MNYVKTFGHDRVGRPLFWLNIKYYRPELMNKDISMRLMCYLFDYVCSIMTANVDTCLIIFDMADFGYCNYSFEMWKCGMEVASVSF